MMGTDLLNNIYIRDEKKLVQIINIIKPKNFVGVKKIIDSYLFNKGFNLTESQLIDTTHKIVSRNLIIFHNIERGD